MVLAPGLPNRLTGLRFLATQIPPTHVLLNRLWPHKSRTRHSQALRGVEADGVAGGMVPQHGGVPPDQLQHVPVAGRNPERQIGRGGAKMPPPDDLLAHRHTL